MRVHSASHQWNLPSKNLTQVLIRLLAEHDVLRGVVTRVTPASVSVLLHAKDVEVELPLKGHSFIEGQLVEITRPDEQAIAVKLLAPNSDWQTAVTSEQRVLVTSQLEQVLVELNIPPTEEAVLVGQGLLERGFALQESLVWSLLPWAEAGQLEEAFMLLEARYPLNPELVAMVRSMKGKSPEEPILRDVRQSLPPDLQRLLERPSMDGRVRWSRRFSEGETFKALARLLVEEKFVESIINREHAPNRFDHVFALPFLQGDDLYAAWVRISREEQTERENENEDTCHRIELEIPTATLGMVGLELIVQGKRLDVTLLIDQPTEQIEDAMVELRRELATSGWNLRELKVRRWADAQGSRITV